MDEQSISATGDQPASAKAALLIIMEFFLHQRMISPRFPKSSWDAGDENIVLAQCSLAFGKIPTRAIRIIFTGSKPLSKALPYGTNWSGQSPAAALVSVLGQLLEYNRAACAGSLRSKGNYRCCSKLSLSVQPERLFVL